MTKKGKNGGNMKNNEVSLPTFCYCCGKSLVWGSEKCSNEKCRSHENNTNFASKKTTFCTHCQEYIYIPQSKRCPNCNIKLHGCIANSKKYVCH